MVKINNIIGIRIKDIVLVYLEDILLEVIMILEHSNYFIELSIEISDDSETIRFNSKLISSTEISRGEIYELLSAKKNKLDLKELVGHEVLDISFGVGCALNTKRKVLYYFKLTTKVKEFLFFNNGDRGVYSIDFIAQILKYDIYGYTWEKFPP
jgi:hypothetical protein